MQKKKKKIENRGNGRTKWLTNHPVTRSLPINSEISYQPVENNRRHGGNCQLVIMDVTFNWKEASIDILINIYSSSTKRTNRSNLVPIACPLAPIKVIKHVCQINGQLIPRDNKSSVEGGGGRGEGRKANKFDFEDRETMYSKFELFFFPSFFYPVI